MIKILLLFVPMAWSAVSVDLAQQSSQVEFLAVVKPGGIKINGTGGKLGGNLEIDKNQIKGRIAVNLNDLTTGIDRRDKDMKEKYLETAKFSDAWLEIDKIDLPEDFLTNKKNYSDVPFSGKLSLHGVEKPVSGTADVDTSKDAPSVATEFKISIAAFNIQEPKFMGIKVADEVTVKTRMNLNLVKQ